MTSFFWLLAVRGTPLPVSCGDPARHWLILFCSLVLFHRLGGDCGDGVAGFVRSGAVGCRGADGAPGFAATKTDHCRCQNQQ